MRILYITSKPIYPKVDGGCVAMDKLLQCLLLKDTEVKHLTLSTEKHPYSHSSYPTDLQDKVKPESIEISTKVTLVNAFLNLFKKGSYNVNRFHSKKMENKILSEISNGSYDVILLESLYSSTYLDQIRSCFSGKIILRIHNIESDIWDTYQKNEKSTIKKLYLKKLSKDIRQYEFDLFSKVDSVLAISEDDQKTVLENIPNCKCETIPVSIDIKRTEPFSIGTNLFHLGAMNWTPNIESVSRLIKIFPEIRKEVPSTQLRLAGANFPKTIKGNLNENIFIDGFVDSVEDFAANTGILVSPIISGSGVRIKILEMMSLGIPIVTTKTGAKGINCGNNNCIVIADTDKEIVNKTIHLIKDADLRKEIGQNAIDYIKSNHNIETISNKLIEQIQFT